MADVMKTPGVYIVEKNALPNSVVEVATAVPAFVGYTEKADNAGNTLRNKPWRISSMAEFKQHFGVGPITSGVVLFSLRKPESTVTPLPYLLTQTTGFYLLYFCMLHFFQNGGGPCFIVSVGGYDPAAGRHIDQDRLMAGIHALVQEQEPTMLVVPEAVLLNHDQCAEVQKEALRHCGDVMKNRIAILDIPDGDQDRSTVPDCVTAFRDSLGNNFLSYGAAYYPWVNTTVVPETDLGVANIEVSSRDALSYGIQADLVSMGLTTAQLAERLAEVEKVKSLDLNAREQVALLTKTLTAISPFFKTIMADMRQRLNALPPGAAIAGIFTMIDNARGVWKAPANVSLNGVVSPTVPISHEQQEDLNVTPQGKSVNAIRAFVGEGTLVWGARTLDGNSLDWRYINVRRTIIMLEESIRLAAKALVFEPNTANTWVTLKSMIENFLVGIWRRGGLAGIKPEDAFGVHIGLGQTMTAQDIHEGILRGTVLVALIRPAEFIEITFQQQMQTS